MKYIYIFGAILLPTIALGDCESFLNEKLEQMNLGSLKSPSCGVTKSETVEKTRVSMSKVKGRKDSGPTLSMYNIDPSNVKVVQLLSKDKLTKHRQKYTYIFGTNCNEFKSVTYTLGTLQTEVTRQKCNNIKRNFVNDEVVHLSVNKICDTYFEEISIDDVSQKVSNNTGSSAIKD